jgi:hypothetical protein
MADPLRFESGATLPAILGHGLGPPTSGPNNTKSKKELELETTKLATAKLAMKTYLSLQLERALLETVFLESQAPDALFSTDFLWPSCPLKDAIDVLETHPKARALFQSPVHFERLPLPDETKAFIRVLKNPQTGGVVYLIGTAHI